MQCVREKIETRKLQIRVFGELFVLNLVLNLGLFNLRSNIHSNHLTQAETPQVYIYKKSRCPF